MKTIVMCYTWSLAVIGLLPGVFAQSQPVASFNGHRYGVTGVAFAPEGERVVSVAFRDARIWERSTGREVANLNRQRGFTAAFRPDGEQVAVGGYDSLTIHDAATGRQLSSFDPHGDRDRKFPFPPCVLALAYSPDGELIATAASIAKVGGSHGLPGGVVRVFDAATGKEVRECGTWTSQAVAVAFSPDGKYLAAGSNGASSELPEAGELRVWDTTTFNLVFAHKGDEPEVPGDNRWSASTLAFSPDGSRLVSGGHDGTVRVWEVPSGKELLKLHGHGRWIGCVAFGPTGVAVVSAAADGSVRAWDAATGIQLRSIPFDAKNSQAMVLSPDASRLATGGGPFRGPGAAHVWLLIDEPR